MCGTALFRTIESKAADRDSDISLGPIQPENMTLRIAFPLLSSRKENDMTMHLSAVAKSKSFQNNTFQSSSFCANVSEACAGEVDGNTTVR